MKERLRFTGQNPPRHFWTRYPNWENAIDEEGFPDQDETTLRPASNQSSIDRFVTFTAGEAALADGRILPAFISLAGCEVWTISVYPETEREISWGVQFHVPTKRWLPMNEAWFLSELSIPVPLETPGIFPMEVSTRLPLDRSGEPLRVTVHIP